MFTARGAQLPLRTKSAAKVQIKNDICKHMPLFLLKKVFILHFGRIFAARSALLFLRNSAASFRFDLTMFLMFFLLKAFTR